MSRNVLVSCGKVKEADQVEVEIMKQGEKFCGIVYCAIPDCRQKVKICCRTRTDGSWSNSNFVRHLKRRVVIVYPKL